MGGEEAALTGPDLGLGVSTAEIPDGGALAGHAGGKPVLLVRKGPEWFAIGAVCSHYSGPLPEGLVVGDTVRCPGTMPASACGPARHFGLRPQRRVLLAGGGAGRQGVCDRQGPRGRATEAWPGRP